MAARLAALDEPAMAQARVAAVLKSRPGFSVAQYVGTLPFKQQADRDHICHGLHKAGLPP